MKNDHDDGKSARFPSRLIGVIELDTRLSWPQSEADHSLWQSVTNRSANICIAHTVTANLAELDEDLKSEYETLARRASKGRGT